MNERLNLDDVPLDDFESGLIASGKREGMGAAKKRALVLALAGGAAAATIGAAGTAKAATAGVAATATKAKGAAGLAILKWIAAGLAGSALAVGATKGAIHVYETERTPVATFTTGDARGRGPTGAATTKPQATSIPPAPAEKKEEPPSSVVTASDLPAAPPVSPAMPPVTKTPTAAGVPTGHAIRSAASNVKPPEPSDSSKTSALADELKTIERARTALAANDATGAARALDEHDRLFPNGAFAEEAHVLRIDVHAKKGDVLRARSEARAYLALHPGSPYAPRLRVLAGEQGGTR